jgi:cysteine desulfurase
MSGGIYLDHHATTPVDKRVLEKMLPFFLKEFGNPASIDHQYGAEAKTAVDQARDDIARFLGCRKDSEIIFTSGATESNNLSIIGAYRKYRDKGKHIISTGIEHPSVLDTLDYLKSEEKADITLIPVDKYGMINLSQLKDSIRDETILISVMFANNEIGTIQPIKEVGTIAKEKGILFHCDAAQAVGHEHINVYDLGIDLLSFSAHKFYGPKGIGGLFIRSFSPMVRITPIMYGGGHERGFRSGTLNVPGIIGMAEALKIAKKEMDIERDRLKKLKNHIYQSLLKEFPVIKLNGHPDNRLSHNLNITIPGVESKALILKLKGKLSFSAGSAWSTVKVKPSHVLKAIGLAEEEIFQTIRIGLGRGTIEDNISNILIQGIKELESGS